MLTFLRRVKAAILRRLVVKSELEGDGERVDINYSGKIKFDGLDMYQKSHYRRYEFARSVITPGEATGDFACGTGYGSVILAEVASKVTGVDLNGEVVEKIRARYAGNPKVEFRQANLLDLEYKACLGNVVSFETIEHLREEDIPKLFNVFSRALRAGGTFVFSVPYLQKKSPEAIKLGFHLTFDIDEARLKTWLAGSGFVPKAFKYQNYKTHDIADQLEEKDFIICVAQKG